MGDELREVAWGQIMMVLVCICHGKDLYLVSYSEALSMDLKKKENSLISCHQTQINQIYGLSSMLSVSLFPFVWVPFAYLFLYSPRNSCQQIMTSQLTVLKLEQLDFHLLQITKKSLDLNPIVLAPKDVHSNGRETLTKNTCEKFCFSQGCSKLERIS